MHSPSRAKVAMDRLNTRSTKRDFVDHHSIRRNQVLLIIITILVQFHLPYFSLSSALAAEIDTGENLDSAVSSEHMGEAPVFPFNERRIPYLNQENGVFGTDVGIRPRLLGIHISIPEVVVKKTLAVGDTQTILVTAYSSTKDQTDSSPCTTANGFDVCAHGSEDIIAANFLPFGTHVQFPEYFGGRQFTVQDRMHQRFARRIDIWMKSRAAAKEFGVKRLKMVVVPENVAEKDSGATRVAANF